ncbi:4-hydroxy-3-methylbut-2-en-1-yl diphosphate synthase [Bacteroidales bacterium Barb6XT]|nr:4-hydroxy-3-methylbut-2-en-1-yl diphosphate synthase [Bacteroidales bacterium Barb6XT]
MSYFNYCRRKSSVVRVGNTPLGGDCPVRIQSMANVSTMDTEAAVQQAMRMSAAGAEYIRFTAQGEREARNLGEIRQALRSAGCSVPLVADIHFNPKVADVAAQMVEKVRINPGNYAAELQKIRLHFIPFLRLCREHGTAVRIGVNHGSLSDRIMSRYGDTPEGMAASCMEFLRICREEDFPDVVISIKASNTVVMVQTVRLLVQTMEAEDMHYPLHLGVTEAGEGEDGRIKSAVGIGVLLSDGIGDTVRVSLSEDPEAELPVARKLVDYVRGREGHTPIRAILAPRYDCIQPERRVSRQVADIGGGQPPVVIPATGHAYPPSVAFIRLTPSELTDEVIAALTGDTSAVVILSSSHRNPVGEMRAAMHRLLRAGCDVPVILCRDYNESDGETLIVKAAADFGTLLLNGFGDGLMMNNAADCAAVDTDNLLYGILQAVRLRISRTEYISCPGCGRTLFDLQTAVARVKAATAHLKGLKIAVMGCIVNGPGEMADADYGYVGAGRGRVSLYRGRECMLKNIPEADAVSCLTDLIKAHGDWER